MNIKIRKARFDDAGEMTDLIIRSKRSNGYDKAFMAACYDALRVTPEHMKRSEYWVAEADVLCGCAGLLTHSDNASAEVNAFFVDPNWQGKGVGRLLWAQLAERAKALKLKELHLDSDPNAVPFYEALGFAVTGQSPSEAIPGRVLPLMTISID